MIQDDDALPPHQRKGWAERMYEQAEMRRKEIKEERLLEQHEAAINQEKK